jgi:hypothetical protein
MLNLVTIPNGFIMNSSDYLFDGEIEIISETQCHAPTDKGIILLDLSCTINDVVYTDINLFVSALTAG